MLRIAATTVRLDIVLEIGDYGLKLSLCNFAKRLGDLATEAKIRIPRVRSGIAERLIEELGMSLAGVARLLGASTSALSKILQRIGQERSE